MKRIVIWASIHYAAHIDGATIHITGPDERQVEFGDGTTSFATLSGGEGYINSTVTVNAPDFVTMTGASVNEMMALIRDQQATIVSQQVEIGALKQFVGMAPPLPPMLPPSMPPSPPMLPPSIPPPPSVPPYSTDCSCHRTEGLAGTTASHGESAPANFINCGFQHDTRHGTGQVGFCRSRCGRYYSDPCKCWNYPHANLCGQDVNGVWDYNNTYGKYVSFYTGNFDCYQYYRGVC